MPKKRKVNHTKKLLSLSPLQHLKRKHKGLHKLIVFAAIITIWRAVWTILDYLLAGNNPLIAALVSLGIALLFLFLDDFKFQELER